MQLSGVWHARIIMNFFQYPADIKTIFYLQSDQSAVPADDLWLTPEEATTLSRFRIRKRRRDWLLGRWTAKSALCQLARPQHLPPENWQITSDSDGAPCAWLKGEPADLSISISHSAGLSFFAVTGSSHRMGCDLEKVEERNPSFEQTFFTGDELKFLSACEARKRNLLVTLIWSAKESVLKAIRTGLRADTRRIRILSIDQETSPSWQSFTAQDSVGGDTFNGWWLENSAMVYTVASDRHVKVPLSL